MLCVCLFIFIWIYLLYCVQKGCILVYMFFLLLHFFDLHFVWFYKIFQFIFISFSDFYFFCLLSFLCCCCYIQTHKCWKHYTAMFKLYIFTYLNLFSNVNANSLFYFYFICYRQIFTSNAIFHCKYTKMKRRLKIGFWRNMIYGKIVIVVTNISISKSYVYYYVFCCCLLFERFIS